MRRSRLLFLTVFLFLLLSQTAFAQSSVPLDRVSVELWIKYSGILAIGWGVGVLGWLVTGHQAMSCLFVEMPRAWKLWKRDMLTSSLPIYKYLFGGALLIVLGTVLVDKLWGIWAEPFDVGLFAGLVVGVGHTLFNPGNVRSRIDFLEANQRFLNKERVSLFSEYQKP